MQRLVPQKQIGRTFSGENSLFSPLARSRAGGRRQHPFLLFRPSANSFFEKRVTGKHTKKEFGRTLRGKSGFPSVPQGGSFFRQQRNIHPFRQNSSLRRSCFIEVVIRGARAAIHSKFNFPAKRDFFLLLNRLSPQAKDLFWKLSALRTVSLF